MPSHTSARDAHEGCQLVAGVTTLKKTRCWFFDSSCATVLQTPLRCMACVQKKRNTAERLLFARQVRWTACLWLAGEPLPSRLPATAGAAGQALVGALWVMRALASHIMPVSTQKGAGSPACWVLVRLPGAKAIIKKLT